jgi:hypothetical protein
VQRKLCSRTKTLETVCSWNFTCIKLFKLFLNNENTSNVNTFHAVLFRDPWYRKKSRGLASPPSFLCTKNDRRKSYFISKASASAFYCMTGLTVAQAVSRWLPTAAARVGMWGLWWTKRHWGRFSLSTSVSPANHHSTNFSIIIITRGWRSRPIGGRSAEWTQLDFTPNYTN